MLTTAVAIPMLFFRLVAAVDIHLFKGTNKALSWRKHCSATTTLKMIRLRERNRIHIAVNLWSVVAHKKSLLYPKLNLRVNRNLLVECNYAFYEGWTGTGNEGSVFLGPNDPQQLPAEDPSAGRKSHVFFNVFKKYFFDLTQLIQA